LSKQILQCTTIKIKIIEAKMELKEVNITLAGCVAKPKNPRPSWRGVRQVMEVSTLKFFCKFHTINFFSWEFLYSF